MCESYSICREKGILFFFYIFFMGFSLLQDCHNQPLPPAIIFPVSHLCLSPVMPWGMATQLTKPMLQTCSVCHASQLPFLNSFSSGGHPQTIHPTPIPEQEQQEKLGIFYKVQFLGITQEDTGLISKVYVHLPLTFWKFRQYVWQKDISSSAVPWRGLEMRVGSGIVAGASPEMRISLSGLCLQCLTHNINNWTGFSWEHTKMGKLNIHTHGTLRSDTTDMTKADVATASKITHTFK